MYIHFEHVRGTQDLAIGIEPGCRQINLVPSANHVATSRDTAVSLSAGIVKPDLMMRVDPDEYIFAFRADLAGAAQHGFAIFARKFSKVVKTDGRFLGKCQFSQCVGDKSLVVAGPISIDHRLGAA